MTATYLIVYGLDPSDRIAAYAFNNRAAARAAENRLVPSVPVDGYGNHAPDREARPGVGGCGYIIEKDEDVAFGGSLLVAVYNALTGCTVNKFESKAVGVKRLMAVLADKATIMVLEEAPQPSVENKMDGMSTETTTAKRGRKSQFSEDARITVVKMGVRSTGKNASRYEGIQDGITVAEALASGALSGDLSYAVKRGWITIN